MNRAERQGKDNDGGYIPKQAPGSVPLNDGATAVADVGKGAANATTDGVKNAGGFVGGLLGGGDKKA
jgi:hypothetical protein